MYPVRDDAATTHGKTSQRRTFATRTAFFAFDRGAGLAAEEFPREDELESRQPAVLYPVGRVLRQTFDADNHDSLGTDLTGLMLQLARIDPDTASVPRGEPPGPGTPPAPVSATTPAGAARERWWRSLVRRLLAR